MTVTVGPIGTAPTPTASTIGDRRIDLTTGTVWRNTDGAHWNADFHLRDDVIAALLNEPTSQAHGALSESFVAASNVGANESTPRAPFTTTFELPATTGGTDDFVGHALRAIATGDYTGVSAANPGWFFGTNIFTTTGPGTSDGVGLTNILNLVETSLQSDDFTGTAVGLQVEAAFMGAGAGGTAASMMSMKVAAPKRKDGAVAGNATSVFGLYIDAVPAGILGSSEAYALFVAGGASYLSGDLTVAGALGIPATSTFYLGSRQLKDDGTNVTSNSPLVVTGFVTGTAGFYTTGDLFAGNLLYGADSSRKIVWCNGTPEGSVAANVGSLALRLDGGASTTLYVKQSGTGNTGWVAK